MSNRRLNLTDEEWGRLQSRPKLCDGFYLSTWVEFLNLMNRLGVRVPRKHQSVEINFPERGEENVTVKFDDQTTDTGYDGYDAFGWPETQAWLRRMGFVWDAWTLSARIEFGQGILPKIHHTYAGGQPDEGLGQATNFKFSDDGYVVSWEKT